MAYGIRPAFICYDLTQNPNPDEVSAYVEVRTKEMLETPACLNKKRTKLIQEIQRCNRWLKINNAENQAVTK